MNNIKAIGILSLIGSIMLMSTSCALALSEGEQLLQQANALKENTFYHKAYETYEEARKRLLAIGDSEKANTCRIQMHEVEKILIEFPYTKEDALKLLGEHFKDIPQSERNSWFQEGKIDFIISDNKPFYLYDFIANLKYRNPDLMKKDINSLKRAEKFVTKNRNLIFKHPDSGYTQRAWKPYINPVTYLADASLFVPREKLPEIGLLKLWIPLPIRTGAQDNVRVISITPEEYVKFPPQTDGDIGFVYLEISLDELKKDLRIQLQFEFMHYEQHFLIDPGNVGKYDTDSYLYKQYTRSYNNTTITPEIRQKAQEIVEDEKNPYLAAKRLYEYIVERIDYSHMPHASLNVLGIPESVYVHERSYGDCGAQGTYFSALCRSLGIPARTSGGMQLCPGEEGTHFWAEFYLPNYGWIPVDTSIAQIANYPIELTDDERRTFKNFFFGKQDSYRYIIQKDVDVPLIPEPEEPILLPMAIQFPAVVCASSLENPAIAVLDQWKIEFKPIYH